MFKRLIIAIGLLLAVASPASAGTFTPCLRLSLPTPNDPAVANVWGTILNTDFSLIDTASGGTGTISVAGSSNVVLTANSGATDQSRSANFVFTGALTGNINVLFPAAGCGSFSVKNSTSGAFSLSIGANNGSGSPAGAVVAVPAGGTIELVSDGTNVRSRIDVTGLGVGLLASSPANTMVGNWTGSGAAPLSNAMPSCADSGGQHLNFVGGTGITCGTSGPGSSPAYWQMNLTAAGQTITGGAPDAVVAFNSKSAGSASYCSTTTGICTPNVAGTYSVFCQVDNNPGTSSSGDVLISASIYKNTSRQAYFPVEAQSSSAPLESVPASISAYVSVNGSTDSISCRASATQNGAILNDVSTGFNGQYVAP